VGTGRLAEGSCQHSAKPTRNDSAKRCSGGPRWDRAASPWRVLSAAAAAPPHPCPGWPQRRSAADRAVGVQHPLPSQPAHFPGSAKRNLARLQPGFVLGACALQAGRGALPQQALVRRRHARQQAVPRLRCCSLAVPLWRLVRQLMQQGAAIVVPPCWTAGAGQGASWARAGPH
jgi:hypothetical protein